jgi:hypothetical protein
MTGNSEPLEGVKTTKEPEEAVVNGSRTTEIHQQSIKNTLKEIISEIEEAVVSEVISDSSAAPNTVTEEASPFRFYSDYHIMAAPNRQKNYVTPGSGIPLDLRVCMLRA